MEIPNHAALEIYYQLHLQSRRNHSRNVVIAPKFRSLRLHDFYSPRQFAQITNRYSHLVDLVRCDVFDHNLLRNYLKFITP